jgi:fucokinase
LNVALDFSGHPPVRATIKTLREPKLILESHDLGTTIDLTTQPFTPTVEIKDPFALHKVALQISNLLPSESQTRRNRSAGSDLRTHLKKLGAGLHITTECRVPKGSGLGTSSILGATLLAALQSLPNSTPSIPDLIEQTLLLEQRLSTGGGWQDQVGGMVGGVKSTITAPGIPQRPVVEPLSLSDAQYNAFQDRLVVYYTGQQRLARDILRRVMGRWLAREPAILLLMDNLKKSSATMRAALLKSQWRIVAKEISRYWQIKKELYPGSTTPSIDVLFLEMREHYQAAGIAGAGAGGFAYFFCATPRHAMRLRGALEQYSTHPGNLGTVYPTQINRTGLTVKRRRIS